MSTPTMPALLKVALILAIVGDGLLGLVFLLLPEGYIAFTQAEIADVARLRWPGGVLIGFAVGSWLVLRSPAHQAPFVLASIASGLLATLSLAYSLAVAEYTGRTASMVVATIVLAVVTLITALGYRSGRELLR